MSQNLPGKKIDKEFAIYRNKLTHSWKQTQLVKFLEFEPYLNLYSFQYATLA